MLKLKKNKILIVVAHPDDEVLGCGGTISKLKATSEIRVIYMTDGVSSRGTKRKIEIKNRKNSAKNLAKFLSFPEPKFFNFPDNRMDTVSRLKIIKKIEQQINNFKPYTIITHYAHCLNIDHRITYESVITACRPINKLSVKKILSFEIPSSTEWAFIKNKSFEPNYFIDITNHLKNKMKYLNFYKKELRNYPHSRSIKAIRSLASVRGVSCGVKFAEGFYLNRFVD